MMRLEWQEDDPDDDGDVVLSIVLITDDKALLARMRRALKAALEDTPRLATIPRRDDDG
jgi:hypothetical protein